MRNNFLLNPFSYILKPLCIKKGGCERDRDK